MAYVSCGIRTSLSLQNIRFVPLRSQEILQQSLIRQYLFVNPYTNLFKAWNCWNRTSQRDSTMWIEGISLRVCFLEASRVWPFKLNGHDYSELSFFYRPAATVTKPWSVTTQPVATSADHTWSRGPTGTMAGDQETRVEPTVSHIASIYLSTYLSIYLFTYLSVGIRNTRHRTPA